MATVTYNGKLPRVELVGYGHFAPGDSKAVDDLTAAQMDNDLCKEEGWSVDGDGKSSSKKSADTESTKPAAEYRRAPRNDE